MQPITTNQQYPTRNAQNITCKQIKIKQLMLPGLALLRVKLLKTCCLWTSGNLLLDLLFIQDEPTDVGSYMR
jgi:hypothetical protein